MTGILDSQELPIECANCSRKTNKTIAWIKAHDELTCACGTVITIHRDELLAAVSSAEDRLRGLTDQIRRLGKTTIKFKL